MMRWTAAAAFLLAACATRGSLPVGYDFDPPAEAELHSVRLDAPLAIPQMSAPTWLRGTALVYRIGYVTPSGPQPYALSRWVASPAELFTAQVRERVAAANRGFTLTSSDPDAPAYVLTLALEEFIQVFDAPTASRCIVQVRATLADADGRVIGQRTFRTEAPAPSADAPGAIRGLTTATDAGIEAILVWLGTSLSAGHDRELPGAQRRS